MRNAKLYGFARNSVYTNQPPSICRTWLDTLGAKVIGAERLISVDRLEELERLQAFAFSAATFEVEGKFFVVTNPLRSEGRSNSDVAHELAHLLLNHQLSEVRELDGVPFRTCRPDEEEQATAMGATLMLPRPLLLKAVARGTVLSRSPRRTR